MMLLLSGTSSGETENYRLTVTSFTERLKAHHPDLTCQDVYKALFQYVNGMEHSARSEEEVLENLEREICESQKGQCGEEPLLEFLSEDLKLCRLNIRPYMRSGGSAKKLASAFIQSSQQFTGNPERFKRLWKTFMDLVQEGILSFDRDEAASIDREAERSDYRQTFSHSTLYRDTYHPSYRVIMTQYLEKLW